MPTKVSAYLLAITIIALACASPSEENVVATVGEFSISEQHMQSQLRRFYMRTGQAVNLNEDVKLSILNSRIERYTIVEIAKEKGWASDADAVYNKAQIERKVMMEEYQRRFVYDRVQVSMPDLRELFQRFNTSLRASHLHARTREEADSLYRLLQNGASFEQLAAQRFKSTDLATSGGDLGYFTVDEMDIAFEAKAFSMKVGDVSEPVATSTGYSIIKLTDRISVPVLTETQFAEKIEDLRPLALEQKRELATRADMAHHIGRFAFDESVIRDTVRTTDLVQIRGVVNNAEQTDYFGQVFNWGSGSVALTNVGGDYWSRTLKLAPGDVLKYKIYTGKPGPDGTGTVDHSTGGWESVADQFYTVPADASGDITLPVIYYNRVNPIAHSKVDTIAVRFRVNVGAAFAINDVNDLSIVGVRGGAPLDWGVTGPVLTREPLVEGNRNVFYSGVKYLPVSAAGTNFQYKFVIQNGTTVLWDSDPNRPGRVGQSDTTLYFSFFQNRRPPSRPVVNASLQFAVSVGVLEELALFNRALGDRVFVPGGFNGWNTSPTGTGAASYSETFDAWTRAFNITEEVGATVAYKYFVRWDQSRFESASPNYIANLAAGAGWEEPGITGGGNRIYTYTADLEQNVIDDAVDGLAYFNGVPPYGVIRETRGAFNTMPVTFRVDMTAALTHTTPFNPTTDSLFLAVQTPIWALTQGIPSNNDGFASGSATAHRILFKAVEGQPNIYELVYQMRLPADNMIGFALAYRKADGTNVINGGGFDAGRRYYRYITPYDALDRANVLWPDAFTLQPISWKATNLDFEAVPTYNNGVSVDRSVDLATEYVLSQNYPNPFNPSTTISFNLPQSGNVTLTVYNVLGQQVATLVNGALSAGTHSVPFNASRLASGVYIYELRAGSFVQQKRMMLVK